MGIRYLVEYNESLCSRKKIVNLCGQAVVSLNFRLLSCESIAWTLVDAKLIYRDCGFTAWEFKGYLLG